jgi:hypothetical protein
MNEHLSPTFDDPLDYDLERAKLARRRKIAEGLIATEADAPRMMGNWVLNTGPAGGVAAAIGRGIGTYDQQKIDEQSKLLSANEARDRNRIMSTVPTSDGTPEGDQKRLAHFGSGLGIPSLRQTLQAQIGQELDVPEKRAELERARTAKREDLAIQLGSQAEMKDEQREWQEGQNKNSNDLRREIAGMVHSGQTKPPSGYRFKEDGSMEAVPGGPADTKLQGQYNADTAQLTGSTNSFDRLATATNALLNHPGLAGITGLRGAIPNVPGSDAADAQALLNTLKSQVGFGVLQDMRNNSKTGGALGNVSDQEGKRLEANLAALENAQSEEQMKRSLKAILTYTEGAKDRLRDAYNLRHKGQSPVVKSAPQSALDALKANPAMAPQFKAKYGYLPEGY